MKLNSFKNLLIEELKDIYHAEQQLVVALPKLAEAAVLPDLKHAFAHHLEQTKNHLDRLDHIFVQVHETPEGNNCRTMSGLIAEANNLIALERKADPGVLDAALIGAMQKVEHFEIAAYGCARTYAEILGLDSVAELLQQTLDEEGETDKLLNQIATQSVNPEAADATSEDKALRHAVVAVLEVTH
jgi:ferritin-like metal-binding protein YciE